MKKSILFFMLLTITCLPVFALGEAPHTPTLLELQNKISQELARMDYDLSRASIELASTGLTGEAVAEILQKLYNDHSSVIDAATIDMEGRLVLIQPHKYKASEGKKIDDQAHFAALKKTKQPMMTEMFKTVERFYAVSLTYPIVTASNETIGFVSVVFRPEGIMRKIFQSPLYASASIEVVVIQEDGRIIYDKDILQIGRMTFSDPLYQSYPDLLKLARRMVKEDEGTGSYTFQSQWGKPAVTKESSWTTVRLHGTEWRLILSRVKEASAN